MRAEQDHTTAAPDHDSHPEFVDYYARESLNDSTQQRLLATKRAICTVLDETSQPDSRLEVTDVGCGAGSASILWAKSGHAVHGLDVNEPLLKLARQRAEDEGLDIDFRLGTATDLPWQSESMDVCLAPELLEHVADWQSCLDEFCRILRPNGVLFLSTSNKLCPVQQEFTLPLYSWYPAPLKRYFERLAMTTHPEIAGHAKYPAVNWFTFYQLRDELRARGLESRDRFDLVDRHGKGSAAVLLLTMIERFSLLRWFAHVATPYTMIFAVKTPR